MKFSLFLILALSLTAACGNKKKKKQIVSTEIAPLCLNGLSNDPDIICNPLGGGGGSSSGGSTDSGSTTVGSTDGGSTTSGSSTGGSTTGGADNSDPDKVTYKNGLLGYIYEGDKSFKNLNEFKTRGIQRNELVYFTNFDLPDRDWSKGFVKGENEFLKTKTGDKLVEWFSFYTEGFIQLPVYLNAAKYDLMAISDDGVRVSVAGETVIESLNNHGAKVICASKLVDLSPNLMKSFKLDYYQGPRYKIALSLYLKRVEDPATYKKSTKCNKVMTDPEAREAGWTVVPASYFYLPLEM